MAESLLEKETLALLGATPSDCQGFASAFLWGPETSTAFLPIVTPFSVLG